jgi:hypothetical protein
MVSDNTDFDGGSSSSTGSSNVQGGFVNPVFVPGACAFVTNYKNVAKTRDQLSIINWTFKYKNDPYKLRFFNSGFNVHQQAQVAESINLESFFHPLLVFSTYQKQTFVIAPDTTVSIDPGDYTETANEAGFIFARAYYLPESIASEKFLLWDYGGDERYPMGEIMALSGGVKQGVNSWAGWNMSPFAYYGHTGPIYNPNLGGISFSNITTRPVKLVVITSN